MGQATSSTCAVALTTAALCFAAYKYVWQPATIAKDVFKLGVIITGPLSAVGTAKKVTACMLPGRRGKNALPFEIKDSVAGLPLAKKLFWVIFSEGGIEEEGTLRYRNYDNLERWEELRQPSAAAQMRRVFPELDVDRLQRAGLVMPGADVAELALAELVKRLEGMGREPCRVLFVHHHDARRGPAAHLKIQLALQLLGHTVAAGELSQGNVSVLQHADLPFTCGIAGTDVAKDASHMILMDGQLAGLVDALERCGNRGAPADALAARHPPHGLLADAKRSKRGSQMLAKLQGLTVFEARLGEVLDATRDLELYSSAFAALGSDVVRLSCGDVCPADIRITVCREGEVDDLYTGGSRKLSSACTATHMLSASHMVYKGECLVQGMVEGVRLQPPLQPHSGGGSLLDGYSPATLEAYSRT